MKKNSIWNKFVLALVALALGITQTSAPLAQNEPAAPEAITEASLAAEGMEAGEISQKITMDLKGVDILDVLKILSKRTGINIVAGRNVQGNVTLYLQNVNAWSALKRILETAELAFIEEEGIIRVMTDKDYEELFGKPFHDYRKARAYNLKHAKASEVGEIVNQIKSNVGRVIVDERTNTILVYDIPHVLEEVAKTTQDMDTPTESKVITVRYASVEDLEPKLRSIVNPVTGSLEIDKRSNKVYVRDLPGRVQQVESLVSEFDAQPYQVLIDAKVIEVALNDQNRFGIDWNAIFERSPKNPFKISAPLTITNPTSGPLSNVTFATITGDKKGDAGEDDFNFVISALAGVGKTNTLSSPRLTVMNNQEAKLAVATREPFISQTVVQGDSTATTADNVQFVDVGVTLTVKPTITSDDHVMIKIKPAVSTSGTPLELQGVASGSNTTFVRTRVPVVTTQEVETTVIVKSGSTIVMGGLIQDRIDKSFRKIPVLGDIPVMGAPFRNKIEDAKKTELVVFLTPVIIKPDKSTEEGRRFLDKKGDLLDFDQVANVDFTQAYHESNHPFKRRSRPYWQDQLRKEISQKDAFSQHPLTWDALDYDYVQPPVEKLEASDMARGAAGTEWIAVEEEIQPADSPPAQPVQKKSIRKPRKRSAAVKAHRQEASTAFDKFLPGSYPLTLPSPPKGERVKGEGEWVTKSRRIERPSVEGAPIKAVKTRRTTRTAAISKRNKSGDLPRVKRRKNGTQNLATTAWFESRNYSPTEEEFLLLSDQKAVKRARKPVPKKAPALEPVLAERTRTQPRRLEELTPQKEPPAAVYTSFVPENQSRIIFQEIQDHFKVQDPVRVTWRAFFQSLKADILATLKRNPTLAQIHGDVRLEFAITRMGTIRNLQVLDTRHIRGPGQKWLIAEVLSKRRAYTPLPAELGDEKKIHLTVRI